MVDMSLFGRFSLILAIDEIRMSLLNYYSTSLVDVVVNGFNGSDSDSTTLDDGRFRFS